MYKSVPTHRSAPQPSWWAISLFIGVAAAFVVVLALYIQTLIPTSDASSDVIVSNDYVIPALGPITWDVNTVGSLEAGDYVLFQSHGIILGAFVTSVDPVNDLLVVDVVSIVNGGSTPVTGWVVTEIENYIVSSSSTYNQVSLSSSISSASSTSSSSATPSIYSSSSSNPSSNPSYVVTSTISKYVVNNHYIIADPSTVFSSPGNQNGQTVSTSTPPSNPISVGGVSELATYTQTMCHISQFTNSSSWCIRIGSCGQLYSIQDATTEEYIGGGIQSLEGQFQDPVWQFDFGSTVSRRNGTAWTTQAGSYSNFKYDSINTTYTPSYASTLSTWFDNTNRTFHIHSIPSQAASNVDWTLFADPRLFQVSAIQQTSIRDLGDISQTFTAFEYTTVFTNFGPQIIDNVNMWSGFDITHLRNQWDAAINGSVTYQNDIGGIAAYQTYYGGWSAFSNKTDGTGSTFGFMILPNSTLNSTYPNNLLLTAKYYSGSLYILSYSLQSSGNLISPQYHIYPGQTYISRLYIGFSTSGVADFSTFADSIVNGPNIQLANLTLLLSRVSPYRNCSAPGSPSWVCVFWCLDSPAYFPLPLLLIQNQANGQVSITTDPYYYPPIMTPDLSSPTTSHVSNIRGFLGWGVKYTPLSSTAPCVGMSLLSTLLSYPHYNDPIQLGVDVWIISNISSFNCNTSFLNSSSIIPSASYFSVDVDAVTTVNNSPYSVYIPSMRCYDLHLNGLPCFFYGLNAPASNSVPINIISSTDNGRAVITTNYNTTYNSLAFLGWGVNISSSQPTGSIKLSSIPFANSMIAFVTDVWVWPSLTSTRCGWTGYPAICTSPYLPLVNYQGTNNLINVDLMNNSVILPLNTIFPVLNGWQGVSTNGISMQLYLQPAEVIFTNWTLSLWVYDNVNTISTILPTDTPISVNILSNASVSAGGLVSNTSVTVSAWNHIVIAYNGSIRIWINGSVCAYGLAIGIPSWNGSFVTLTPSSFTAVRWFQMYNYSLQDNQAFDLFNAQVVNQGFYRRPIPIAVGELQVSPGPEQSLIYASSVLSSSPYIYWKLNDVTFTGNVLDSSAINSPNNGTFSSTASSSVTLNQPSLLHVGGGTSYSRYFGDNQYSLCSSTYFTNPVNITVEFWYQLGSGTRGVQFFTFQNSTSNQHDRALSIIANGSLSWYLYSGFSNYLYSSLSYLDNNIHHLVLTMSNSGTNIYIDTNLVLSSLISTSGQNYIGQWCAIGYSNGILNMDEFAVYSNVLSISTIITHYEIGINTTIYLPSASSLSSSSYSGVLSSSSSSSSFVFSSTSSTNLEQSLIYEQTVLIDTPTVYWKLDETSYGLTVLDYSSVNATNNGTYVNTTSNSLKLGTPSLLFIGGGTSYTWNPTGNGYYVCSSTSFVNPQVFSIEFWYKISIIGTGSWTIITFTNSSTGNTDRTIALYPNGSLAFYSYAGHSEYTYTMNNISYNDGNTHYGVVSMSSNGTSIYVDGYLAQFDSSHIAGQAYTGTWCLSGTYSTSVIDEVAFYMNTTLSPSRIATHHQVGMGLLSSSSSGVGS